MFKVGDKVKFKKTDMYYSKYPTIIFTIQRVTKGRRDIFSNDLTDTVKVKSTDGSVSNEWFITRFELAKPRKSHLPVWF